MIKNDGKACLADVGLNQMLSRIINGDTRPVPSSCMFKAPEELLPDSEPSDFVPTKEMDMYSFASTVYTVCHSKSGLRTLTDFDIV